MKLTKVELVINSLIHNISHAYNNYNFEVYIKWVGILPNNKRKNCGKFDV